MSVFTAVCIGLAKYKPKSCDMNIIICIIVSYPSSPHTLSLQYETGFVCKCDSIEMRTCA